MAQIAAKFTAVTTGSGSSFRARSKSAGAVTTRRHIHHRIRAFQYDIPAWNIGNQVTVSAGAKWPGIPTAIGASPAIDNA
jgi:hypothetical protein